MKTVVQFIVLLIGVSLFACAYGNGVIDPSEILSSMTAVNAIKAEGPFNLFVKTGEEAEKPSLYCDQEKPGLFEAQIKNHTLYLTSKEKHLMLSVTMRDLKNLGVNGLETVVVKAVKPAELSIFADRITELKLFGQFTIPMLVIEDKGDLSTSGQFDIRNINYSADGIVDITGLHSQQMMVKQTGSGNLSLKGYIDVINILKAGRGDLRLWNVGSTISLWATGQGHIELVGYAKQLKADLEGSVSLNAFGLFANHLFVSTTDKAFARIHPLNRLFAAARDSSQISYNYKPRYLYVDPLGKGLVLYSREGLGVMPTLPG
jgi:hypothetical protein